MSRTLVLMRHAAAEGWSPRGDKGRALSEGGRAEATSVGKELASLGIQRILCSAAQRTRETVACLGLDAPVEYMDALYNCSEETLLQRIGEIEDEVTGLLVVAHAPAIPGLASNLVWSSDSSAADNITCWFPTGAFTQFTLDGPWGQISRDETLKLVDVQRLGH